MPTHVVLGRAAGLSDEKMAHLGDRTLPVGLYTPDEAIIVQYAQASTRMEPIGDDLYEELTHHFSVAQIIDICFIVGMSNLVNRFHATFLTDVDESTIEALSVSCPVALPEMRTAPSSRTDG